MTSIYPSIRLCVCFLFSFVRLCLALFVVRLCVCQRNEDEKRTKEKARLHTLKQQVAKEVCFRSVCLFLFAFALALCALARCPPAVRALSFSWFPCHHGG